MLPTSSVPSSDMMAQLLAQAKGGGTGDMNQMIQQMMSQLPPENQQALQQSMQDPNTINHLVREEAPSTTDTSNQ